MKKIIVLFITFFMCPYALAGSISSEVDSIVYDSDEAAEAEVSPNEPSDSFKMSVGAILVSAPEFEGSDKYDVKPVPIVDIRYKNFFLSAAKGLGVDVIRDKTWTVSPSLRYRFSRDEGDSYLLKGMGDIDGGLEAGAMVSWHPYPIALVAGAYHGFGDAKGYTIDLSAIHSRKLSDKLTGTLVLSATYADSKYNQAYFGVDRKQSVASGYQVYSPGGGFKHGMALGTLSWQLNSFSSLSVFGQYKKLTGPAADSPLVKSGSDNQFMGGVSVNFNMGQ